MEKLLKQWNLGNIASIEPLPSFTGMVNKVRTADGRRFILKEKSGRVKVEREADLLFELAEAGAPVATPVRSTTGDCIVEQEGKIYCLYPQLPGRTITKHYGRSTTVQAERFGKAIARLHGWLSELKSPEVFPDMRLMEQIREWALPCCQEVGFAVDGIRLEQLWTEVKAELSPLYEKLPSQLIHRDAHPGNMLFEGEQLTGFVDFEMVTRGPRIFDLCYCGTSVLAGGFPDDEKRHGWPGLFHGIIMGYEKVSPLYMEERKALYGILIAIELLFVAFSLEGGSEDAARQNESMVYWLEENRGMISG